MIEIETAGMRLQINGGKIVSGDRKLEKFIARLAGADLSKHTDPDHRLANEIIKVYGGRIIRHEANVDTHQLSSEDDNQQV